MTTRRITAKELARMAGLHRTTVSRILNRDFAKHNYSPETIRKVERLAGRHGYRRNRAAHALKTGKSRLAGLLMPDLRNPWFGELASTMDEILSGQGYRVVIADSANSFAREKQCLQDLAAFDVAGLIFAPCGLKRQKALEVWGAPVVILDYDIYPARPCICLDHDRAARTVVSHMRERGRRKGGLVCHDATASLERSFLSLSNRTVKIVRPPAGMRSRGSVDAQVKLLLGRKVDAIVGLNNELTAAALDGLHRMSVGVPSPLGVIGVDDLPLAHLLSPPLTVLSQPVAEYGRKAADYLQQMMAKPSRTMRSVRFPGKLIVRGSL